MAIIIFILTGLAAGLMTLNTMSELSQLRQMEAKFRAQMDSGELLRLSLENHLHGKLCTYYLQSQRPDTELPQIDSVSGSTPVISRSQVWNGVSISRIWLSPARTSPEVLSNARIVDLNVETERYGIKMRQVVPLVALINGSGAINQCYGTFYRTDGRTGVGANCLSLSSRVFQIETNSCVRP